MTRAQALKKAVQDLQRAGLAPALAVREAGDLLAHAIGLRRSDLYWEPDLALSAGEEEAFQGYVARRMAGEPLQYILGQWEFMGLTFAVDRRVLIPRPETEGLVMAVLQFLADWPGFPLVIDVGTGSGAIAVSLAVAHPQCRVLATDISGEALLVAKANARRHSVADRIEFRQGDLVMGSVPAAVVVANLPYVAAGDFQGLDPTVRDYEPAVALLGGERGTEVMERLIAIAPSGLAAEGLLALEVGEGQAAEIQAACLATGAFRDVAIRQDLAGRERIVLAYRTGEGACTRK
ncbi:MAG TPA: peptide chain release factor N(5)-glutamine methyltransferase [Firmicutes bacterium]|jgi:release factor glutamine methyltransferase|nr:peptide chain release factor N(5)-glutamine methyltransferase [Bacillota bacterium]